MMLKPEEHSPAERILVIFVHTFCSLTLKLVSYWLICSRIILLL